MSLIAEAMRWIFESSHYRGPNGIGIRIFEHLWISAVVVAISSVVGIPLGFLIGHTGKGRTLVLLTSGGARALPTLGLITIVALTVGIGLKAPLIALVVLALPSVLGGAYAGFESVDRSLIDGARSIGMTELQIVGQIEIPLGLPLLIGGLRSASLQVISTVTLADYVGGGGLGRFIFLGLKTRDYAQMLAGSILVMVLAIGSEITFGLLQQLTQPAGLTRRPKPYRQPTTAV
jgi:osmoprotectant transport system permease protein